MNDRVIFHIDVNSAFLSWSAIYRLSKGDSIDLRKVPSVVGGDEKERRGVVLAKSIPAKKYGIVTGEPILNAKKKCPELLVISPSFSVYSKCSDSMLKLLQEYTPIIEKFSIDECFMDLTGEKEYIKLAHIIKERIRKELGFTVNIGISNNKLLAKMASDFEKPNKIHTLFPKELKNKMWPLPVEELFMVGKATISKLYNMNIHTIGDLANYDLNLLKYKLKNHGRMLWNYANGIDDSKVEVRASADIKTVGNSTTISFDVKDRETAHKIILSLCENTSLRLRELKKLSSCVSIVIKNNNFSTYSKQQKLNSPTDCTNDIINTAYDTFDKLWKGDPIRLIGVTLGSLSNNGLKQISLFDNENVGKKRELDKVIDSLRNKYGNDSIMRSSFLNSNIKPIRKK